MRIVTLCATQRGHRFVQRLVELAPHCAHVVFSFPEETWEPQYIDDIRQVTGAHGGTFFQAKQVGSAKWQQFWETTPIDLMFTVSWRYKVPTAVFKRPRVGTFVFHDSLLPEYRGFSPTVWSMINGESYTGVTLFEMADGIDEGDIVAQKRVPIGPDETIDVILERVTETYLKLLEENLECLLSGRAIRHPQEHVRATYTCKRIPEDNLIDWRASTADIYNLIRAVTYPYPGAYTYIGGQKLRVWSACPMQNGGFYVGRIPGRVVAVLPGAGTVVLTGDGALRIKDVQLDNGEIVCASEVLNSMSQTLGR